MSTVGSLRPLSIGEILDRAFSICFKHLLAFAAIVMVVVGPQIILYYLGFKDVLNLMTDQMGAAQGAAVGASAVDPTRMFQAYANGAPYFGAFVLIALFLAPISNAALVSGISRAYLGLPVRFGDCYRDGLPRYLSLLALMVLWFATAFVAAILFFVTFFLLSAALAAIPAMLHGVGLSIVGVVIATLIGIAVGVALLLVVFELYLAAAFSFLAVVLERLSPWVGFTSGFSRVFGESQFWRSAGIAVSIFGVILGLELVAAVIGGTTVALTRSFGLDFAVSGIVGAFTYPFSFAVAAVSYYDVRIRREGFDLQVLASQLGAAAPSSEPAR